MKTKRKTALITGSGKNIGRSIAINLAAAGFNIVINGSQNRDAAQSAAEEVCSHGVSAIVAMGDIGNKDETEKVVKSSLRRFGAIDILVNNAAIRPHIPFLETDDKEWQRVFNVNLRSNIWLSQMILPSMVNNGWGRIINFSGMNAQRGYPGAPSVSVTKHAVWGLTKALASEFGPYGITTNIISPGTFPPEKNGAKQNEKYLKLINENPTRRLGKSNEIGSLVSFLCSENGGFINGQMLQINGGVVMQY